MRRKHDGVWSIAAVLLALPFALPLLCVVSLSLLSQWEIDLLLNEVGRFSEESFLTLRIPPMEASLQQYGVVLLQRSEILWTLLNSLAYAALTVGGMLLTAPGAAFVFAKLSFKGKNYLFYLYIVALLLPFQVLCVPQYLAMQVVHLIDTPWAFILPEMFSPLPVFLLRQFMKSIPDSVLEAAALDGANLMQTYVDIVLPMSKPALAVATLLCCARFWNLVEQPLLFIRSQRLYPISLYVHQMMSAQCGEFLATCVLAALPMLLLYLCLADDLRKGIRRMNL